MSLKSLNFVILKESQPFGGRCHWQVCPDDQVFQSDQATPRTVGQCWRCQGHHIISELVCQPHSLCCQQCPVSRTASEILIILDLDMSDHVYSLFQDIWPTCDQFLSMMVGSEIEHALLLCNFFSGLSKKAFLVIGKGVPEGDTSYVLTVEESGEHLLWNPVTGEHFSTTETFCPLEAVYAIVNEGNVWGNLQPSDRPSRLRWDLSATSDWVPLFSRGFANPGLPSVQPAEVHVSSADHRIANQLKERVERILR